MIKDKIRDFGQGDEMLEQQLFHALRGVVGLKFSFDFKYLEYKLSNTIGDDAKDLLVKYRGEMTRLLGIPEDDID